MNRREMLKVSGFSLGTAALGSAAQTSRSDSQTTRKYKIVITGGHPGDPEYGCGGTIARLTSLGHEVVLLYMNDGAWETSATVRIAEAKKACEILKARPAYASQANGHAIVDNTHYQAFQSLIEKENPDAVFTHWPIDNHPDHRGIANLTFEAWKQLKRRFPLYYYEVSDGEDTTQFPAPTHYVDITEVAAIKKSACYATPARIRISSTACRTRLRPSAAFRVVRRRRRRTYCNWAVPTTSFRALDWPSGNRERKSFVEARSQSCDTRVGQLFRRVQVAKCLRRKTGGLQLIFTNYHCGGLIKEGVDLVASRA